MKGFGVKTIFKYQLSTVDRQDVRMPMGARILTALVQNGVVCVWAEVDGVTEGMEPRTIWIVGTGNPMPGVALSYINSVMQGPFVWHVYEEPVSVDASDPHVTDPGKLSTRV